MFNEWFIIYFLLVYRREHIPLLWFEKTFSSEHHSDNIEVKSLKEDECHPYVGRTDITANKLDIASE